MAALRVDVAYETLSSRTPSPSPIANRQRNSPSEGKRSPLVKSPSLSSLAGLQQVRLQPLSPNTTGPYQQKEAPMVGSPARALRRSRASSCSAGYRGQGLPMASQSHGAEASWSKTDNHEMVIRTFKAFCGCQRNTLDVVAFTMLCKQCFLIDARFTQASAEAVFHQVSTPGEQRMSYFQFESALKLVAQKRGVSMDVLFSAVALCAGPLVQNSPGKGRESRRDAIHESSLGCSVAGGQTEDANDEDVSLQVKAQAALFIALCCDEDHDTEDAHDACDVDPNLALKVKAQAALLQALCAGDDEDEEEAIEVHDVKVKAQEALMKALEMDDCLYENAGVEHADVDYLKAKAREALNVLAFSEAHHSKGDCNFLE